MMMISIKQGGARSGQKDSHYLTTRNEFLKWLARELELE